MADGGRAGAVDDFILEEHSGVSGSDDAGGDEAASGLELDDFQAKEIRQIFLVTLPEYLEPLSQMLEQVLSAADGQEQARRALQTTLSSISAAASRVGVLDVCSAVDEIRDQLLLLDDEPMPPSAEFQQGLRKALAALQTIAGAGRARTDGPPKQTIVAALEHVEGIDKSVLERLTAAGLVTVDQLRIADAQEVVAVTGLDASVVKRLLALVLGAAKEGAPADEPRQSLADDAKLYETAFKSVPTSLEDQLRARVDLEASLDELRAEILSVRLGAAACKERLVVAEHHRDRLQKQLSERRNRLADTLARLTEARLRQAGLERKRAEQLQAVEAATRRVADLEYEYRTIVAARDELALAVSELVHQIAQVKSAAARSRAHEKTR